VDRRWTREIKHYVKNEDELMPPVDRFNAGQKQFYWVMFVCTGLLVISGVVMWVPEYFPARTNWMRQTAILIHEIAALLTIGAFIVHIYMGLFVVPGGFKAMVHGDVSQRWARTHHPLWLQRTRGRTE
jgi:formate dehydrogenase subunit gamma